MARCLLIGLVMLSAGCAVSHSPRFVRYKVPVSPFCSLTLIYDQRTTLCLAAYACGVFQVEAQSLVVVPRTVCEP